VLPRSPLCKGSPTPPLSGGLPQGAQRPWSSYPTASGRIRALLVFRVEKHPPPPQATQEPKGCWVCHWWGGRLGALAWSALFPVTDLWFGGGGGGVAAPPSLLISLGWLVVSRPDHVPVFSLTSAREERAVVGVCGWVFGGGVGGLAASFMMELGCGHRAANLLRAAQARAPFPFLHGESRLPHRNLFRPLLLKTACVPSFRGIGLPPKP